MNNKKLFKIIIVFLIFVSVYNLSAEEDLSSLFNGMGNDASSDKISSSSTDGPKDFELNFVGEHTFEFHMPVDQNYFNFDGEIKSPKFKNDIGIELNYKILKLVSHCELDLILNEVGNLNQLGDWNKLLRIRPLENYISVSPWKLKFSVGLQYFSWGVSDKQNPTDNINPRDYSVGLDSDKIPILSASASIYPVDFFSLETVYVPFEQADIFPADFADRIPSDLFNGIAKQWLASDPLNPTTIFVNNTKDISYKTLEYDPRNFLAGGKLNFYFPIADFSFSYLYDLDPFYTPVIELQADPIIIHNAGGSGFDVSSGINYYRVKSISLEKKRIHRFGADVKFSINKVGLWLECEYSMTENYLMNFYKLRNHKLNWTLGFDVSYGPNNDFYINCQYFGDYIPLYDSNFYKDYTDGEPDSSKIGDKDYMEKFYYRALVNNLGYDREGLLQGLSIDLKWPVLNSLLTPEIAAAYLVPLLYDYDHELRYGSLYLNPKFDIMPIDSLHITLGAELFFAWHKLNGKDVDLDVDIDRVGYYFPNNNIFLEVKYKWGAAIKK